MAKTNPINSPIAPGGVYDRSPQSNPLDLPESAMSVGTEMALLRGAVEQAAMRAEQLIERLEPISDRTSGMELGQDRDLPPATSKLGAEMRDTMSAALRVADRLSMAAEMLRL